MSQKYFDEAQACSVHSNCAKRKLGAVLVKDGVIIARGWNSCCCGGASRTEEIPREKCQRLTSESGKGYELSRPVHAEIFTFLSIRSGRAATDFECCLATVEPTESLVTELFTPEERASLLGTTLYLSGHHYACASCKKWAELLGIAEIVFA
ncbi:MAG: hypothetical protein PHE68_02495 [Candidatus Peribacteraceae bacterium]|nr:hypothetical protein [Candidatus Peribacteraceae bacterium]MDD5074306.1 hypothetical protein [Candidatus Peribacteraceae bacterium]